MIVVLCQTKGAGDPLNNSSDTRALTPPISVNQTVFRRLAVLLPWIVSLWLILMTGWYAATAVGAFEHPLNTGDDLVWVKVWAGFAIAVVLSHLIGQLIRRRRLVTLMWLGVLIATALAMIALSHQVISALITAWLLLLAGVWGDWTLHRLHVVSKPLDRVPVVIPLGLALLSLLALALCLTQLLTSKWAWLVCSALTLVQYRSIVKIGRAFVAWVRSRDSSCAKESVPEFGLILVLLGFVFLLDLSWALAPEIHSDALVAHLPVAQYYVEHPVAFLSYGYIANLVNFVYAIALSLHGQIVAKLLVLASSVISALGAYVLGRMLFSARAGLWAAALFYSTPLVSWLSTTAFIDAPVTMFLVSTTLVFFQWRETRQNGLLWATGLLTGASIAAKLNTLLGLPVIGLVLLWDVIRSHDPQPKKLKGLAGYILAVCLVAGPGFALCYILTGNPFFPLPIVSKLFKNSTGPAVTLISNANSFGRGTSPLALLKFPYAFTFETQQFGEALPSGGIGLALMLVPLALITLAKRGQAARQVAILLGIGAVYLLCLAFIIQYGRYYIPALPVVTVLGVQPIIDLSKTKWTRRLSLISLGAVIGVQVALTPLMFWNIPERFPVKMAFGLETRESLLGRALLMYDPVQFLNRTIEPGHKILALGGEEGGRVYLNAHMATLFDDEFKKIFNQSTPSTLAANLIKNGFTYLLVNRTSWQSQLLPAYKLDEPFLSRFTTLEYSANRISIYRLREIAVEPGAAANLLTNPGFEVLSESGLPAGWSPLGHPLIARSSAQAHEGKMAVRADLADGLNTRVRVDPNKIYSLGYWCRADKPNQLARLQINWLNEALQIQGISIDVVPATPQWKSQRLSAMSPPGTIFAEVYVSVHENSEVWFDDYMFVPGEIHTKP